MKGRSPCALSKAISQAAPIPKLSGLREEAAVTSVAQSTAHHPIRELSSKMGAVVLDRRPGVEETISCGQHGDFQHLAIARMATDRLPKRSVIAVDGGHIAVILPLCRGTGEDEQPMGSRWKRTHRSSRNRQT
mgnify:CR=1 FL=1